MRIKTELKKALIAIPLILLSAMLLFCFTTLWSASAATETVYLEADLLLGEDLLPSTLTYTGAAYDFGFKLYRSSNAQSWSIDETKSHRDNFELKFYDVDGKDLLGNTVPQTPGNYRVKVVAKDSIRESGYNYRLKGNTSLVIIKGDSIAEKSFSIQYESLSLSCTALDRTLELDVDQVTISDVIDGVSLLLNGQALQKGKTKDYYVEVEKQKSDSTFVKVDAISEVGVYRLKVRVKNDLLERVTDTLATEEVTGVSYGVLCREFSVTRTPVSLSLTNTSMYVDDIKEVSLSADSKTWLSGRGIGYGTTVYLVLSSKGSTAIATPVSTQNSGALSYSPNEAGDYIYRVNFPSAKAEYGIGSGDFIDLAFTVKALPYKVSYSINNSPSNILDYEILNTPAAGADEPSPISLSPWFVDLDGNAINSVYDETGAKLFNVSYKKWNAAASVWDTLDEEEYPQAEGKYQVIVTFKKKVSIGDYEIAVDDVKRNNIKRTFTVITKGTLSVTASEKGKCFYTGETVTPELVFASSDASLTAANLVTDGEGKKYTVAYFDSTYALIDEPKQPGEYYFEVTFTSAIEELNVAAGAVYHGQFHIEYPLPSANTVGDNSIPQSLSLQGGSEEICSIESGRYYEVTNTYRKALTSAPNAAGGYKAQFVTTKADPVYRIAANSIVLIDFSCSESLTKCEITVPTTTYDGGVKEITFSFSKAVDSQSTIDVVLQENLDYSVTYFKNGVACGKPILAGTYSCLITYLRTDSEKGIKRGIYQNVNSFTVNPLALEVVYEISNESKDLIYDALDKTYDVSLRYEDTKHPVSLGITEVYSQNVENSWVPFVGADRPKDAGNYLLEVSLTDSKSGSLTPSNPVFTFTVQPLSLQVCFTVPLSYRAMWCDEVIVPEVSYVALNGRYSDEENTAYSALAFKQKGIAIFAGNESNQSLSYSDTADGVSYTPIAGAPVKTGKYMQTVTKDNPNVFFYSASAIGDDGGSVTAPSWNESQVMQTYSIYPCEVEVSVTYDDDLYYTGTKEGGVKKIDFYAYQYDKEKQTGAFDKKLTEFDGVDAQEKDYRIYYYSSDYKGVTSGLPSTDKPVDKGYYVARVMITEDATAEDDDSYLSESRYTFRAGKNAIGEEIAGAPLYVGCYWDFIFRIKDQNKLDVIYNMPDTFAENEKPKEFSVTFLNKFSEVPLVEGEGQDYLISYLNADGSALEVEGAPSTKGRYLLQITFLKDNVAYVIDGYSGTYTKEGAESSDLYLCSNDVLTYEFEIFAPRALNVELVAPDSLYYDGDQKAYDVNFSVTEAGIDSVVTMTRGTHYKVYYYKMSEEEDKAVSAASIVPPTLPGRYAVEVVFLTDLPDYTFVIDGESKPIAVALIPTIGDMSGVFAEAKTERLIFTVEKAILTVTDVKANGKVFDGTNAVTFSGTPKLSVKTVDGIACGAMVKQQNGAFPFHLSGTLAGTFKSDLPAESVEVNLTSYYTLEGGEDLYVLDKPPVFAAKISKGKIYVVPTDVTKEYNPYAVISLISYNVVYGKSDEEVGYTSATLARVFPNVTSKTMLVGNLSRETGSSVGQYKIVSDPETPLRFNDEGVGLYEEKALSDLFDLQIENATYTIVPRNVTIAVVAGQSKVFRDPDPVYDEGAPAFAVVPINGTLNYGDKIVCTATREKGENVGTYKVTLSDGKILTEDGNLDVTDNYHITLQNGTFEIVKRSLIIAANKQEKSYMDGFDPYDFEVLNESGAVVTDDYVTTPSGDRISGKLAKEATDDPFVFNILKGSIIIVDSSKKDVSTNYDIEYTTETYTIKRTEITVQLASNPILEKFFGEPDPKIDYTISSAELERLGSLRISETSSVSREPGEDAGSYNLYRTTTAGEQGGFRIYDQGVDVSKYFSFFVKGVSYGIDKFTIKPRPITVTVEDETYENTGREVIPIIKYLNENGTRLPASVLEQLKVKIVVPSMKYQDGENLVTPEIEGDPASDPNFIITFKAGKITMIYLQNRVVATAVKEGDSDASVCKEGDYLLSGIMMYKAVKVYKLSTANGNQPDKSVMIELPIDDTVKGEGLVVVALYADSPSKAFSFEQSGATLVYYDDGAYYAVVAEVQEWFYVIWGVVLIAAGVVIYFIVVLIRKLFKKNQEKQASKPRKAKKPKNTVAFAPNDAMEGKPAKPAKSSKQAKPEDPKPTEEDSMFSSEAVPAPAPAKPENPVEEKDKIPENTDHLFADDMLSDRAPTPIATSKAAQKPAKEEEVDVSALDISIPTESKPVAPDKKHKEKGDTPKGFKPGAFKPKAAAGRDTLSDEQFIDQMMGNDMLSDAAITADNNTTMAPTAPKAKAPSNDELIISRSSGFSDDDPTDPEDPDGKGGDGDLL